MHQAWPFPKLLLGILETLCLTMTDNDCLSNCSNIASVCIAGLRYGKKRHPEGVAAYRGAWLDAAGNQRLPSGFAPHYLLFAFLASFATPVALMLLCLLLGHGTLAVRLLAGYQATFAVQMLLETKLFHRERSLPA